jgi:hypothetical protein
LKLVAENDAPIYSLASATQPFYNIRLDPTSASAYVTVSRHDPTKIYRAPPPVVGNSTPTSPVGGSSSKNESKAWQEVLTTTLEEESRKLPPNDGLVALLYPAAAAKLALERPHDLTTVMRAEQECARLVWDADSGNHYLVHPALALPFCVTVERSTAWSRTEYTLEHIESPHHLGRLTRDGTGAGWLELDTTVAAQIDAVYLIDVAITALLLVAHKDDQFSKVEVFAPPPVLAGRSSPPGSFLGMGDKRGSRGSARSHRDERTRSKKVTKKTTPRMEEFDMDIESQPSDLGKPDPKDKDKEKDKLPGAVRAIIGLITITLKCALWFLKIAFKLLELLVNGLAKCVGVDKV